MSKQVAVEHAYTAQTLATMPTLCTGQCCSLKVETAAMRVWLCRVEGGVTIEEYNGRRWEITGGGCTKRNFVARVEG